MKKSLLVLVMLLLASIFAIPGGILPAHASATGEVCIAQPTLTKGCPAFPVVLAGTPSATTPFDVSVNYGGPVGGAAYNTFDISVFVPQADLSAPSTSAGVTVSSSFSIVAQICINGLVVTGTCSPFDAPGIVHVVAGTLSPDNANRTLFTIHYTAGTTTTAGIAVAFLNVVPPATGCSNTSASDHTTCVTLVNPTTTTANPLFLQTGLFSSTATTFVTATPNTLGTPLGVPLTISGGSSGTTTANVTVVLGLTAATAKATVAMTATPSVSGPTATLALATLLLPKATTASLTDGLTITVPSGFAANFTVTVTGSETGGTVNVVASAVVSVTVPLPPASLVQVVAGTDGNLYSSQFIASWGAFTPLAGQSPSLPALCHSGPGTVELVVRGADNAIYHKTFSAGVPSATWDKDTAGGLTIDAPSCAVLGSSLFVVVRGANNNVFFNKFSLTSKTWGATWTNLGGATNAQPIIVSTAPANRLDLFVVGGDTELFHMAFIGGTPSGVWDAAPSGLLASVPAVVSDGSGIDVVVQGFAFSGPGSGPIWFNRFVFSTASWAGWQFLNGDTTTVPAITIDSTGTIRVAVTGLDNAIYTIAKPSGGSFGAWTNLGGLTTGRPAIAALGNTAVVLVRGNDSNVKSNFFNGSAFLGWTGTSAIASAGPVESG